MVCDGGGDGERDGDGGVAVKGREVPLDGSSKWKVGIGGSGNGLLCTLGGTPSINGSSSPPKSLSDPVAPPPSTGIRTEVLRFSFLTRVFFCFRLFEGPGIS